MHRNNVRNIHLEIVTDFIETNVREDGQNTARDKTKSV